MKDGVSMLNLHTGLRDKCQEGVLEEPEEEAIWEGICAAMWKSQRSQYSNF